MPENSVTWAGFMALALKANKANGAHHRSCSRMMNAISPIGETTFWKMFKGFEEELLHQKKRGLTEWVAAGADEFIRKVVSGGQHLNPIQDEQSAWLSLAGFVRQYARYSEQIAHALRRLPGLERGDDAFSDFCDALPLIGQRSVRGIINGEIKTYGELKVAIALSAFAGNILHDEIYVHMTLWKALEEHAVVISRRYDEDEGDSDDE